MTPCTMLLIRKCMVVIKFDIIEEEDKYCIYIKKGDIVIPWKDFNKNMAISIEYNLEYK